MAGGSRIVLDTAGPVRVEKAFVLDPADGQPARLVLELAAVDRETFMRAAAIDNRLPRAAGDSRKSTANRRRAAIRVRSSCIDPGHGGIDAGTRAGGGEPEKSIVLDFSLMLRDKLEKSGKYRVVMTRTDDTFVELAERVRIARSRKAQLFISIHCDALARGEGDAQGATVYTLSDTASDAEAARLAEAENKADVIAGVDLSAEPGRYRRHSDRPCAARNPQLLEPFRPDHGQRTQEYDAIAQETAQVGRLPRAQGAGCSVRPAGTGLCVESRRPEAPDVGRLAAAHRRTRWCRRWTAFSRRAWRAGHAPAQIDGIEREIRWKSWTCGQKFNIKPRDEDY